MDLPVDVIKDDPIKPWKAFAAPIAAMLTYLLTNDFIPEPWDVIVSAAIAGLAVYVTPNPKKVVSRRAR